MAETRYINIKNSTTLMRDIQSMGVVDNNTNAFNQAKLRHTLAMQKLAEERRKERELNNLRQEVDELKQLVRQILEKKE